MLNVQTDHLENHTARLTVEVDAERIDKAMRQVARRLSQHAKIPGFRPGKAPYNIVLNLFGREYVLDQALETISEEIYSEALAASGVLPYAPGSLEEVSEDGRKLVFVVPKVPTVTLGDYRAIRVEAEDTEVTDEMVNEAMEKLREDQAVIEPAERPAQLGDLVTMEHLQISIFVEVGDEDDEDDEDDYEDDDLDDLDELDDDEEDEEDEDLDDEDGDDDEEDDEHDDPHLHEFVIYHRHDHDTVLYGDKRDMMPGLAAEIVGMSAGDEKEFWVEMPNRPGAPTSSQSLRVEARVGQVHSRTLPEWSDALAKQVSDGKFETILELRQDVRQKLVEEVQAEARLDVAEKVLEKMMEQATISYPEEVIEEMITGLVEDFEKTVLTEQGLTLEEFYRVSDLSEEELREQYRERAEIRARAALVFNEFLQQENLFVSADDVDAEIERMSASFGEDQAPAFKRYLSGQQGRWNIGASLTTERGLDLLVAIGLGKDIPAPSPAADEQPAAAEETAGETDAVAPVTVPEEEEASAAAGEG